MTSLRIGIEQWFEKYARFVYRHRLAVLAVVVLTVTPIIAQIPKLTIDTSTEGFLHQNDPTLKSYNAFRDQFGRDEVIIVALRPTNVFSLPFLSRLRDLHRELEEKVPHVDEITSLVNARNTRGEGDELIVEDFLETWPQSEADLEILRQRALSNDMYRNILLSQDGTFTTIVIRTHSRSAEGEPHDLLDGFEPALKTAATHNVPNAPPLYLSDRENSEAVLAAETIAGRYADDSTAVYVAGSPVVTHFLKQSMMSDMRKFMLLAVATVAIFLFVMFRRIFGVVLPLLIVILSLATTLGFMAVLGVPLKIPTQILPSFLLAVGVGTSVHILAIFYQHFEKSGDKKESIAFSLGHSGLAVVMTNVTTASGLLSFSTAGVAPIADLGIFSGIGVMLAFLYTLALLPALLALLPIKNRRNQPTAGTDAVMDRFLDGVARVATGNPKKILAVSAILMVFSLVFAGTIRFSHFPLAWFPRNNPIRIATESMDESLRGTMNAEIIIDTGIENGLYEPDLLNRMDRAAEYLQAIKIGDLFVGKAWSLNAIVKEINQALNENRARFYTIPQNRDLVAQELLLFENSGSDDLEDVVDSQFSMARLTIKFPFKDAVLYGKFLKQIEAYFDRNFPDAEVTVTGMMVLLSRTLSNAIYSMAKSYLIALVIITFLMMVLIGRVRIGMLSMIPNLAPILLTMGVIGFFSIRMDLFTMMVASIAIGLAVDDTIHFMHHFRRYYDETGDPQKAVYLTLRTTGRAMLVTSIVLSLGFFIYAFATMSNMVNFGMLTGFTIVMALAADYLIAPALMMVSHERKAPALKAERR